MGGNFNNDYKLMQGQPKRLKIRRKVKNWGQLMLGTITGLLLGLITESNLLMSGLMQGNSSCLISSNNAVRINLN